MLSLWEYFRYLENLEDSQGIRLITPPHTGITHDFQRNDHLLLPVNRSRYVTPNHAVATDF